MKLVTKWMLYGAVFLTARQLAKSTNKTLNRVGEAARVLSSPRQRRRLIKRLTS